LYTLRYGRHAYVHPVGMGGMPMYTPWVMGGILYGTPMGYERYPPMVHPWVW